MKTKTDNNTTSTVNSAAILPNNAPQDQLLDASNLLIP